MGYELPAERIAQHPLEERDGSRMLLLNRETGEWKDSDFRELPRLLRGDELMIINNARVIPARLLGRREGVRAQSPGRQSRSRSEFLSTAIEVFLVREIEPLCWEALVRPGRKVRLGERICFGEGELSCEIEARGDFGLRRVRFTARGEFERLVEELGHVPLPPYIKRGDEASDRERYQTIFARCRGALAAPTAGLHFTERVLDELRSRGIEICEVTLHVGLGTFEPIRADRLEDHKMHSEAYVIPAETAQAIERAQSAGRPVLAVGTTVVRALEDAAQKSAQAGGTDVPSIIRPGTAWADLFIYPGKRFQIVNQLLTNFHLPKSSLLALVAAFAGREKVLAAYRHAVEADYRFYSYGDCMLIR